MNLLLADGINLPPPELTARDLIYDLAAALEKFRLIEANLAPGPSYSSQNPRRRARHGATQGM